MRHVGPRLCHVVVASTSGMMGDASRVMGVRRSVLRIILSYGLANTKSKSLWTTKSGSFTPKRV